MSSSDHLVALSLTAGNPATDAYSFDRDATDRTSFRVCCRRPAGEHVFGRYHDASTNLRVLDVAHD
jgi:hypothetical protein